MKKMELLYTHGLLVQTRKYIEEKNDVTISADEYDELDASPTGIHLQKGDHEEAVFALADALATHAETMLAENADADAAAPELAAD